jgi:hypothetical protein
MLSKKVGDKLVVTIEYDEACNLHHIFDSLMVGEVEKILRRYDYDDGEPKFFEEHEDDIDGLYYCLDKFLE